MCPLAWKFGLLRVLGVENTSEGYWFPKKVRPIDGKHFGVHSRADKSIFGNFQFGLMTMKFVLLRSSGVSNMNMAIINLNDFCLGVPEV